MSTPTSKARSSASTASARAFAALALLVLLCLAVTSRAATTLSFVLSAGEVNCNEILDVDVVVDGGAIDLRGASITVGFDPALLELVDVVPGALFVDAPCDPFLYWVETIPGEVLVDVAGLGCSVSGPGAIATLRLKGKADGVSALQGLDRTLRTSANLPIAATWTDGTVLVSCPVGAEALSWTTVKHGFR